MEVKIIASTKEGYSLPTDQALLFGAKSAGICYMPDSFEAILKEDISKTEKRVSLTLNSGHHSVYGHPTYNLLLTCVPKMLAMILNNEGMYTTSEKSARYTKMSPTEREMELYTKWLEIFEQIIQNTYSNVSATQAGKLAQENARYMISVFTPTTMEYTVSFQQINYIRSMMKRFISDQYDTTFTTMVKSYMIDFLNATEYLHVDGLNCSIKNRSLSLFDTRKNRAEEFGENYSTTYLGSFAQLAQAQRHRTLHYKMWFDENNMQFYTPIIIRNTKYEELWLKDISTVSDIFPQGTMVHINERGTYENFMLKCMERLCGCAQLEIMRQTIETFDKYIFSSGENSGLTEDFLGKGYKLSPRCKFPNWKCTNPCVWGASEAFSRTI